MSEYFELGHAEPVSLVDLEKTPDKTFYLPMHAMQGAQHYDQTAGRIGCIC